MARKYSETHEWIDVKDTKATVGITRFAAKELGDYARAHGYDAGLAIKDADDMAVLERMAEE